MRLPVPIVPARRLLLLLVPLVAADLTAAEPAPDPAAQPQQLLVGLAASWSDFTGTVQCFDRGPNGWHAVTAAMPALFGKSGLAWGRGLHGQEAAGPRKAEGDGRSPAGLFALGRVLGYADRLPDGADFPYHQVTAADCWIEDPALPDYNRHVMVDPQHPPPWYEAQRMRLDDPAYRWLIEVRHNADPPLPGAGSAIFLHIRRGADRPTVGCTALAEADLLQVIRWLRADRRPAYVLLPVAEYRRVQRTWSLPDLDAARARDAGR